MKMLLKNKNAVNRNHIRRVDMQIFTFSGKLILFHDICMAQMTSKIMDSKKFVGMYVPLLNIVIS